MDNHLHRKKNTLITTIPNFSAFENTAPRADRWKLDTPNFINLPDIMTNRHRNNVTQTIGATNLDEHMNSIMTTTYDDADLRGRPHFRDLSTKYSNNNRPHELAFTQVQAKNLSQSRKTGHKIIHNIVDIQETRKDLSHK